MGQGQKRRIREIAIALVRGDDGDGETWSDDGYMLKITRN